jgi:acyl carrier protein
MSTEREATNFRELILQTVTAGKKAGDRQVLDDEDVFGKFGLNSMETFHVLVQLEKALDIVIGEDVAEFDRIRTFRGLESLLAEKVQGARDAVETNGAKS